MNHYKQLATDKLNSLKGQLKYTQDALTHNLEDWERKEFESLEIDLIEQIDDQETLIKLNF